MGAIDGRTWAQALANHFGLPFIEQLPDDGTAAECVDVLPINFAKRYQLLPVAQRRRHASSLATADPGALGPIDDVRAAAAQADPRRRRAGPGHRRRHQPRLRPGRPDPPRT